jgi:hypothetical protein
MAWIESVAHCLTLFAPHHAAIALYLSIFAPYLFFDHASIPGSVCVANKNINIKNRMIGLICHIVSAFGTILAS